MKCVILFSRQNKKKYCQFVICLAESAHSTVRVKVKVFNECKQTKDTAPDVFYFSVLSFDIILHENICYGYTLEVPQ